MTVRSLTRLAPVALLMTGSLAVGIDSVRPAMAEARSDRRDGQAVRRAADMAARAQKAIDARNWATAIALAEAAVALDGDEAGHRALLGAAYLRGGRFASAEQAFGDVMTLQPQDARAALNLALAQIATGKWDRARLTLEQHAEAIPPADRGLALALAGDPTGAVAVLTLAARSPDADAKTRQNLALALALAGRWQEAHALVGMDMAPAEADQRIVQWAAFAQPRSASDQVAALLGVTPAVDPGQPVALALKRATPEAVAVAAAPAPAVDAFMPGAPDTRADRVESVAAASPMVAAPAEQAENRPARGNWLVRIGTYRTVAAAKKAWLRALRRVPALARYRPFAAPVRGAPVKGAGVYRVSVGAFVRDDAAALCRSYRQRGGACVIRMRAGDRIVAWRRPGVQLAAR